MFKSMKHFFLKNSLYNSPDKEISDRNYSNCNRCHISNDKKYNFKKYRLEGTSVAYLFQKVRFTHFPPNKNYNQKRTKC